ncbi:hypothetical protein AB0N99_30805 [Streptomyces sp. NPDC093272]|uniref:hypothetical protein n=1 Tax=Streptomyces sp. NPDC093272 TaxID=3154981 RepID=UPI0034253B4C
MSTAAIRAKIAARGITFVPPFGCTYCGDEQHHHGEQWTAIIGMHTWMQPTQAEILERMLARRDARLNAEPTRYHAATAWAADATGESGEPFCADCKTDGCRRWIRIQARLDEIRWGIPRNPRGHNGSWGGEAPW